MKPQVLLFFITIFCLLSFMPTKQARQTVLFELQLPGDTLPHANDSLYLAGDFNGWHTADTNFIFKRNRKGIYILKTKLLVGDHAFKVVRGNWQTVETDNEGGAIANRTLEVEKQPGRNVMQVGLKVEGWADNFPKAPIRSTAADNVKIVDSAFEMPELQRKRRIWIYLPEDYAQMPERHYPVLYMQDGQNVFDEATAFSQEWGVDEYLNSLPKSQQCIVVAIDNGENERMQEYNPFNNKQFGKAQGKAYAAFLAKTLKPYIDSHYRTKPDARHTAVCGSSMGGLISYYIALTYPDIFGRAGIFSPSFWIAPEIYQSTDKALTGNRLDHSGFYFYGGAKEGDSLEQRLDQMTLLLKSHPSIVTKTVVDPEGVHEEKYWRQAFGPFYQWLRSLEGQ